MEHMICKGLLGTGESVWCTGAPLKLARLIRHYRSHYTPITRECPFDGFYYLSLAVPKFPVAH